MTDTETAVSRRFWQTVPGILTGTAATLGAITTLVAALYQFYKPADPALKTPPAQVAAVSSEQFEAIPTVDGFTAVRQGPSSKTAEKARLRPGTTVACQAVVKGELLWESSDWRYCPSVDGYIHSKLLIPKKK